MLALAVQKKKDEDFYSISVSTTCFTMPMDISGNVCVQDKNVFLKKRREEDQSTQVKTPEKENYLMRLFCFHGVLLLFTCFV